MARQTKKKAKTRKTRKTPAKKKTARKAAKKRGRNPGGRPTECTPARIKAAVKLSEYGLKIKEIATAIGISVRTFHSWMRPGGTGFQEEFYNAVEDARLRREKNQVERTYVELANGYTTQEVTEEYAEEECDVTDEETGKTKTVTKQKLVKKVVRKIQHLPSERAGRFLLTNTKPHDYKEKLEVEGKGNMGCRVNIVTFGSDEEKTK